MSGLTHWLLFNSLCCHLHDRAEKPLETSLPYNVKVIISAHHCVLDCWTRVCCECVTVLITVIKVGGGGGGAVSSSAARMLFIDRLQIRTTCALRHGKREEEKHEMFRSGKLNLHVCRSLVNIHLHHLFASLSDRSESRPQGIKKYRS